MGLCILDGFRLGLRLRILPHVAGAANGDANRGPTSGDRGVRRGDPACSEIAGGGLNASTACRHADPCLHDGSGPGYTACSQNSSR